LVQSKRSIERCVQATVLAQVGDTILAVHTGGYSLGFEGEICGRITSLNPRVDDPGVLAWISQFLD
jgi:hypothetical protein